MAITIRNRQTEAEIRRLGKRWGLGPSAVIRRLAEEELQRVETAGQTNTGNPGDLWDDLMAMVPTLTEAEKHQVWDEMDHMYDYLYEDETEVGHGDRHVRARGGVSTGS
jgi:hypothetical protein